MIKMGPPRRGFQRDSVIPMNTALVIFPHQLFDPHPGLSRGRMVYLCEDPHFFFDPAHPLRFHKKKLLLHRASMQAYAALLESRKHRVSYLSYREQNSLDQLFETLNADQVDILFSADVCDTGLDARLRHRAERSGVRLNILPSPSFLTPVDWAAELFPDAAHFSQTRFYIAQRRRLGILLTEDGKPRGGRWSFDPQNRRRIPKGLPVPPLPSLPEPPGLEPARSFVESHFPDSPGSTRGFFYPLTHGDARAWLDDFLIKRLSRFGDYEDAMLRDEPLLFHSLLTPMLNTGLLTPEQVIRRAVDFAAENPVPLNALEGFVRQIIGWREFMRYVYLRIGESQRGGNFWGHDRPLPEGFYSGRTGIEPLDHVIQRLLDHAYLHHIERLMLLGNFMLLCEIAPDQVYRWFMELFIDAYDWVMVPNVYGMSQFADGGRIMTKPYISSSRYVLKMSDYPKGDWCAIWDGLFWRFIHKNRDSFAGNPRMRMMAVQWDRMDQAKRRKHLESADNYLASL